MRWSSVIDSMVVGYSYSGRNIDQQGSKRQQGGTYLVPRADNVRCDQDEEAAALIFEREQLSDDVIEVHVREVVVHQGCVGDEVLEFELEQLARGLFFVEQV